MIIIPSLFSKAAVLKNGIGFFGHGAYQSNRVDNVSSLVNFVDVYFYTVLIIYRFRCTYVLIIPQQHDKRCDRRKRAPCFRSDSLPP